MVKTLAQQAKALSPQRLMELAWTYKQMAKGGDHYDSKRYDILLAELDRRAKLGKEIVRTQIGFKLA